MHLGRYVVFALFLSTLATPIFAQGWDEGFLADVRTKLNEPRLDLPGAPLEVYRAVWVPTFSHPTSIRLERQGSAWFVVTTRLSGQGGYELGHAKPQKRRKVSDGEVGKLRKLVAEMGLYNAPAREEEALCLDGTIYSYEIVTAGAYRSWIRYCPQVPPFDRYLEFGRAMLKLAKVNPNDVE